MAGQKIHETEGLFFSKAWTDRWAEPQPRLAAGGRGMRLAEAGISDINVVAWPACFSSNGLGRHINTPNGRDHAMQADHTTCRCGKRGRAKKNGGTRKI